MAIYWGKTGQNSWSNSFKDYQNWCLTFDFKSWRGVIIPFESGNDEVSLHSGENSLGKVCEKSGKLDRIYTVQILTAPVVCHLAILLSAFFLALLVFFHLILWHSKHILFHWDDSQKRIFHVLYASAKLLSDHFVTDQQQAVWRIGDCCSWMKMNFLSCKIQFRTHVIII